MMAAVHSYPGSDTYSTENICSKPLTSHPKRLRQRREGAGHVDSSSSTEASKRSRSRFCKGFRNFSSAYSHSLGCVDHMTSLLKISNS